MYLLKQVVACPVLYTTLVPQEAVMWSLALARDRHEFAIQVLLASTAVNNLNSTPEGKLF